MIGPFANRIELPNNGVCAECGHENGPKLGDFVCAECGAFSGSSPFLPSAGLKVNWPLAILGGLLVAGIAIGAAWVLQ